MTNNKIKNIVKTIDEEIDRLNVDYLTPTEIIKLLLLKRVFIDSENKSENQFREILKQGKISHAYKENGCMWYTPKSHLSPILPHRQTGNKGALQCEGKEENSVFIELQPGSCVFHQGGTLHYSRGNSTKHNRRALITNFRPKAMIALERAQGVDHTGERVVKNQTQNL